jgi:hypothetical protein
VLGLGAAVAASGAETTAPAADRERARDDEIADLRERLGVVVDELARLRTEMAVPEEKALEGRYGLGPAASKVYSIRRGTSIGGYAEGFYRAQVGDAAGDGTDSADMLRAVLYVGHRFTDKLVFNSEIEFEHATTGAGDDDLGEVSVEFAALDYLWRPELGLRGGLLLVPMGFLNEVHEPPFYFGVNRPEVERVIIPTTWRENGLGVFGNLGESVSYRVYAVGGLRADEFTSGGLRGGRQSGSRTIAEDIAFVSRVDFSPILGLLVGGSYFHGSAGQDLSVAGGDLPSTPTTVWELHAQYEVGDLHLRALWAQTRVGDAGRLSQVLGLAANQPVAKRAIGGYAEVAYDVLPLIFPGTEMGLEPFFRFEYVDTQHAVPTGFLRDGSQRRRLYIPGISFLPHPNVVLKLDYRNIDTFTGEAADELNLGFGVAF